MLRKLIQPIHKIIIIIIINDFIPIAFKKDLFILLNRTLLFYIDFLDSPIISYTNTISADKKAYI